MGNSTPHLVKRTLDKDLDKITHVEEATHFVSRGLVGPGIGLVFLVMAMIYAGVYVMDQPGAVIVIAAAAIGAYMAMNWSIRAHLSQALWAQIVGSGNVSSL